mgnify:CR=1 FL=1|tara:strand:+ start:31206 stop:32018 length:813 start_codon:yes stop_codon:yes gene_type:complete
MAKQGVDMLKKCTLWLSVLLIGLYAPLSFAATKADAPHGGWIVGGDLGLMFPGYADGADVHNLAEGLEPPAKDVDHYTINRPSTNLSFSAFAGYRWDTENKWLPHYSVAFRYQHLNASAAGGQIQLFSLPSFTNYDYNLSLGSNVFSVSGKVNVYEWRNFSPYVSFGLGLASTSVSNYKENEIDGGDPRIDGPAFNDHTNNNFMFNVGLGVDYNITQQLIVSLGYEYENLGKITSGNGIALWSNDKLSLGTLSTSTILMSVTYQLPNNLF